MPLVRSDTRKPSTSSTTWPLASASVALNTTCVSLTGMSGPAETPLLRKIRESVIGDDQVMDGPYGPHRITYADGLCMGNSTWGGGKK